MEDDFDISTDNRQEITSGPCADRRAIAFRSLGRGCGYKR